MEIALLNILFLAQLCVLYTTCDYTIIEVFIVVFARWHHKATWRLNEANVNKGTCTGVRVGVWAYVV